MAALTPDPAATLIVADHGEPISITFDDLVRYHGRRSVGGLAVGFKALERGLPLLRGGRPPERHAISVDSAFDGPGARDAFEMVTRAVTGGRYRVTHDLALPGAPEAPEGHFVFRLELGGHDHGSTVVELTLRHGLVRDDFNEVIRGGAATPEEEAYVTWLKRDLADRVLAMPAAEVFDAAVRTG